MVSKDDPAFSPGPHGPDGALTHSQRRVLAELVRAAPPTRAELIQRISMAPQSAARLIDELVDRGLVILGDRVRRGRGQPSVEIRLAAEAALALGVSIMSDTVAVGLADLSGELRATAQFSPRAMTFDAIAAGVAEKATELVPGTGLGSERLCGVGVSIAGQFTGAAGRLVTTGFLQDLMGRDLEREFAEALGLPAVVENDGAAAAVGELLAGAGRTHDSFAYLFFGAGLGGGVVVDGRPVRGAWGNAGEFSRVVRRSALESRPTLEALRRRLAMDGVTFTTVGEMLADFDPAWPAIDEWIDEGREPLLTMLAAISAVFDPPAIVFGGRLPAPLSERLIAAVEPAFAAEFGRSAPLPKLLPAEARGDAALHGAAMLPLHRTFFA